jgi:hypothetical protein
MDPRVKPEDDACRWNRRAQQERPLMCVDTDADRPYSGQSAFRRTFRRLMNAATRSGDRVEALVQQAVELFDLCGGE